MAVYVDRLRLMDTLTAQDIASIDLTERQVYRPMKEGDCSLVTPP